MIVFAFDNPNGLEMLEDTLINLFGNELRYHGFTSTGALLQETLGRTFDVVFAQADNSSGIMLLNGLHKSWPHSNLIGVSDEESVQIALLLHRIHASDYLIKPYDTERLADSFLHLRYPVRDVRFKN